MKRRLLALTSLVAVAATSTLAQAAPSSGVDITRWLADDAATRHKLSGGLPLVFSPRPSLEPGRRMQPRLASAGVIVQLDQPVNGAALATLQAAGLRVARRQHGGARVIRNAVMGHARALDLPSLAKLDIVVNIALDGSPFGLLPPIQNTAAEVAAPEVWRSRDDSDRAITGAGTAVCDSDSGIDIFHPSFFFADGGYFSWIDTNDNGVFDMGVDGIDSDGDGQVDPLTVLNSLVSSFFDPQPLFGSGDPSYQVGLDWLYFDANNNGQRDHGRDFGFDDSTPGFGEMILVLDDVNGNGNIDVGEKMVALGTSKVRAARMNNITYLRGDNMIDLPRNDAIGHGTSSAGVIAGGHLGLSSRVGIAPDAELIIAVRTPEAGDLLQLADFCIEQGADVMLHEYAPWAGYHVDGSSPMEQLIDDSSALGVAHINPAGNLSTSKKLYKRSHPAGQSTTINYDAPLLPQPFRIMIQSVLWRDANRPVTVTLEDPEGYTVVMPQDDFIYQPFHDNLYVYGEHSVSSRGTVLLSIYVFDPSDNPDPVPTGKWKTHIADGDAAAGPLEVIAYVQDDVSGWAEGIAFSDHVSEDHLIGWPGTADLGIAVAAYTGNGHRAGEPGERASYSGRGYRIDGEEILSISAPADPVVAGYFVDGEARYSIFGGTSGASPHVAGVAALLIQSNPDLSGEQVRQALRGGALADSAVGDIPNRDWGYGKLRAFNSLFGAAPGANDAPLVKGFEAEIKPNTSVGFEVQASDSEDGSAGLRIEFDQHYDGEYEQLAEVNIITVNFAQEGTYYSKLRVIDSGGKSDEALAIFTVTGNPGSNNPGVDTPPDLTGRTCACSIPGANGGSRAGGYGWLALLGLGLVGLRRRRWPPRQGHRRHATAGVS